MQVQEFLQNTKFEHVIPFKYNGFFFLLISNLTMKTFGIM